MANYIDYRVLQGDTLESIALRLLGDANSWRYLAYANRLRAPFISDEPIYQYGSALAVGVTTATISASQASYTLPLPVYATTWSAGTVFYVQKTTATTTLYDALSLSADVNETNGLITFTTGAQNAYPIGTAYYLFPPTRELTTSVLRSGDNLHIPGAVAGLVGSVGGSSYISLLGTDIQLDSAGFPIFDGLATGDLNTLTGQNNLLQALSIRLNTPRGSVPHNPSYGNPAFDYVGRSATPYFLNLMKGLLSAMLVSDPRIELVESLKLSQSGATVTVDATAHLRSASTLVRIENLVVKLP